MITYLVETDEVVGVEAPIEDEEIFVSLMEGHGEF